MIVGIFGRVVRKELNYLYLQNRGIVYQIYTTFNTLSKLELRDETYLHVVQIIKEDSNELYGFYEEEEKKLFEMVISVNGVGPKSGLAICSTYSYSEFSDIIENSDLDHLKKIPGIGPKSGKQLLLSLSGKLVLEEVQDNQDFIKAVQALESLGFKRIEIKNVLKNESGTLEELIKVGLKKLKGF